MTHRQRPIGRGCRHTPSCLGCCGRRGRRLPGGRWCRGGALCRRGRRRWGRLHRWRPWEYVYPGRVPRTGNTAAGVLCAFTVAAACAFGVGVASAVVAGGRGRVLGYGCVRRGVRGSAAREPFQPRIVGALDGFPHVFGGKRSDGAVGAGWVGEAVKNAAGERHFVEGKGSGLDCGSEPGVGKLDVVGCVASVETCDVGEGCGGP